MTRLAGLATLSLAFLGGDVTSARAATVTFGTNTNQFQIEFVTIGNPGNAPDTTGAPNPGGSVSYEFGIGKFEVSEDMIDKYNAEFGTANSLEITKDTRGSSMPATNVTWNEAARFVNWLNTSTGGFAAYNFTTGGIGDNISLWTPADTDDYQASNPFRSKRATYVLPDHHEWYKAAYYDPVNAVYYDYPTGSDTAPTSVASGTSPNTAVYTGQTGPAPVDQAGGLSPYGVMGMGGNVVEMEESTFDISSGNYNTDPAASRAVRGGRWGSSATVLLAATRNQIHSPTFENFNIGFRVVSLGAPTPPAVPEPTSITIFGLGALGMAYRARRKRNS